MDDNLSRSCPTCKTVFQPLYKQRTKKYCSRNCYFKSIEHRERSRLRAIRTLVPFTEARKGTRKYPDGICYECSSVFKSRYGGRRFCSITCYVHSQEFNDRIRHQSQKLRQIAYTSQGLDPNIRLVKPCQQCKKEMHIQPNQLAPKKPKKFCTQTCYRLYMAERFDRWIASPQTLALPQGYDEFLTQEELPCLFKNCEWSGKNLSFHVNRAHGLCADEFKKLAGFNRSSGICTTEVSEQLRANGYALAAFHLKPGERPPTKSSNFDYERRLEASEHMRKAQILKRTVGISTLSYCRTCGVSFLVAPMSHRYYCSVSCRTRYYLSQRFEMHCFQCGGTFLGSKYQYRRTRVNQPVFCSKTCCIARSLLLTH